MPTNLLDLDHAALNAYVSALDEKPFRARQLLRWIHRHGQSDFAAMTDLARSLRDKLQGRAVVAAPPVVLDSISDDGTRKWLLDVGAGNAIESVFIPEDDRGTLCISSQAGCAVNCRFCSTGRQGFNRNLTTAEIIGQLWWAEFHLRESLITPSPSRGGQGRGWGSVAHETHPHPNPPLEGEGTKNQPPLEGEGNKSERVISNVVLMGMGEPLQNYDAVLPALRLMLDDDAYGLSRRRVTVSTSGMVPQMDRLGADCPVALAVSLHASNDALRDELVPLNRKYPLRELLAACQRYLKFAPRDFITFEYVMLDGVNDSDAHARELISLVADTPCKFNLIPFNPFPDAGLQRSKPERLRDFALRLQDAGIVTTTRKTRGQDIDAACGQLAGEVQDRTRQGARRVSHIPPVVVAR